jgi:hypothetical protein
MAASKYGEIGIHPTELETLYDHTPQTSSHRVSRRKCILFSIIIIVVGFMLLLIISSNDNNDYTKALKSYWSDAAEENDDIEDDELDIDTDIEHSNLIDNPDDDENDLNEPLEDTTTTSDNNNNGPCLPKICSHPRKFIKKSDFDNMKEPLPFLLLASFPGSGKLKIDFIFHTDFRRV